MNGMEHLVHTNRSTALLAGRSAQDGDIDRFAFWRSDAHFP
jgi:hypothetical protein